MRSTTRYEWCLEQVDEHGDITDLDFAENLAHLRQDDCKLALDRKGYHLCLVRDMGNDCEGLVDRKWAYVKDAELNFEFTDELGNLSGVKVPQRFVKEFDKFLATIDQAYCTDLRSLMLNGVIQATSEFCD